MSTNPLRSGAILLALAALLATSCQGSSLPDGAARLIGTQLKGSSAPGFSLTNHLGERMSLSGLRGKPVALTFLYTSCPDTCPLITMKMGDVHDMLGGRAANVAFVVVSVDPERDTVERLRQYLEAQGLADKIAFLTGDRPALEGVWRAYHIAVSPVMVKVGEGERAESVVHSINHTDVVYLIDKAGRLRALMHADFATDDLLSNLEALLGE